MPKYAAALILSTLVALGAASDAAVVGDEASRGVLRRNLAKHCSHVRCANPCDPTPCGAGETCEYFSHPNKCCGGYQCVAEMSTQVEEVMPGDAGAIAYDAAYEAAANDVGPPPLVDLRVWEDEEENAFVAMLLDLLAMLLDLLDWIFGRYGGMNVFRMCGDLSKIIAIIVLFRRLHKAKNAQGISLRTQELYLLVSLARYTDLLTTFYGVYNSTMKLFYIAAYSITVHAIRRHPQISASYDRVQDNFPSWKFLVLPCAVLATITHLMGFDLLGPVPEIQKVLWMFSIYLESVAILPQLSLLRRYRVVENLTGNYIFFMGLYRALYIANWVYRAHFEPGYRHHYVVYACGILQTLLFVEFFYHWLVSKMRGRELRYGDEGDTEYYDCNVNELRTYENSTALLESSDIRTRGKPAAALGDDELGEEDLLVV